MAIKTTILKLIATACLREGGGRALVETGLRFVFFFFSTDTSSAYDTKLTTKGVEIASV